MTRASGWDLRVLGSIEVAHPERGMLEIGGGRQQALLTILLLHRGEIVPREVLIDDLWGENPPPGAAKTLQVYVSRLRRVLGNGLVATRGNGYALEVEPDAVDSNRFESLLEQGRELLGSGDAGEAAHTLRAALLLWRGSPLPEMASEGFAQAEIARLEEVRLACLEERIEADLALGRHRAVVPELRALVSEHPHRERLRGQLMLALYRCGRQEDALELYRDGRASLNDAYGLDPGPELQALERAILNQDPDLAGARRRLPQRAPRRARVAFLLAGLLLVTAVIAATVELSAEGTTGTLAGIPPDSLAVINPETNALTAELPIGSGPAAVAIGEGAVWVANAGDQTLVQVDPVTKQVLGRTGLSHIPTQLAFGQGALWSASAIGTRGIVSRIDPSGRAVSANDTVRVGAGSGQDLFATPTPSAIAVGPQGVFTNDLHSRVWSLSRTGRIRTFNLGASHAVDGVALGAGSLWVASGADDRVLRVDPATGHVLADIPIAAGHTARLASPYGIAVGGGAVWVADALSDSVSRIDPRINAVTATIGVGRRPTRIVVGEGAVWVLNAGSGTVSKIAPARNAVAATISVGRDVSGIAAGLGGVWVTVGGGTPRARQPVRPNRPIPVSSPRCAPVLQAGARADLLIASDLPTFSGGRRPDPTIADMHAAIRGVLRQHNFRAGRYRLAYQACDDSKPNEGADPGLCASNSHAYALDSSLIAVLGSYNSSCTAIALPTLNSAPTGPVAMISPSNTYVGLTRAGSATAADEPDRYYPTGTRSFVRLVAADNYQSAGIVLFLKQLHRRRIFVLNDGEGTGYAGAVYAQQTAGKLGLAIVGKATWNATARNYRRLVQQITRARADAVVISGCICSNGLRLVTELRGGLPASDVLIGTDNFSSTEEFLHAQGGFDGLYVSGAGLPASALPAAGQHAIVQLLHGRRLDDIPSSAIYAAQATQILLDAISRSDGSRPSVLHQLLAPNVRPTITGSASFDRRGDPTPAPIAIYRVASDVRREPHQSAQGEVPAQVIDVPPGLVDAATGP